MCIHDTSNKISKLHIKLPKNKTQNMQIYKSAKNARIWRARGEGLRKFFS